MTASLRAQKSLLPLALIVVLALATWAWRVDAASAPAPSNTVTVEPVRVLDTRNGTDVGLPGPFVNGAAQKLQITGEIETTTGDSTIVPTGATGVILNVTVVRPSAGGFLSVRPGSATGDPSTSSVNFAAGQTAPNSVTVALPTAGAHAGTIDIALGGGTAGATAEVLIDVVGYLVEATPAEPGTSDVELLSAEGASVDLVDGSVLTAATLEFDVPSAGTLLINSSVVASDQVAGGKVFCSISRTAEMDGPFQGWESAGPDGSIGHLSGTRSFEVDAGAVTINLVCESATSAADTPEANVNAPTLTAIFSPD